MVGLIVDLKPERIKKIQLGLRREQDIVNKKIAISRSLQNKIQQNPLRRDKFQID